MLRSGVPTSYKRQKSAMGNLNVAAMKNLKKGMFRLFSKLRFKMGRPIEFHKYDNIFNDNHDHNIMINRNHMIIEMQNIPFRLLNAEFLSAKKKRERENRLFFRLSKHLFPSISIFRAFSAYFLLQSTYCWWLVRFLFSKHLPLHTSRATFSIILS